MLRLLTLRTDGLRRAVSQRGRLNITRTLIDLRVVREFQRTVFEVISAESPEVARRIVARLKERRALRQSAGLPTLDGRGGFDVA